MRSVYTRPTLSEYNARVMACQDEAYTLACYALGDDEQAEQIVQAAVGQAFWHFDGSEACCRELILSAVAESCRRSAAREAAGQGVFTALPIEERLAVILVDVLALSYRQAAEVMRRPTAQFARLLAQGRYRVMAESTQPTRIK